MKKILYLAMLAAISSTAIVACSDRIDNEITGEIIGTVADMTTGEPVPTVNIVLSPGGESTLTGSDGNYMFTNLDAGTYTLSLTKEGYTPIEKTLEVKAGLQTNGYMLIRRIPSIVTVDSDSLVFGAGTDVNSMSFNIVNSGYEDLEWQIEYDCVWIQEVKGTKGVLPYGKTQTIVVFIDRKQLSPGYNKTVLVVKSSNGSSNLRVTAIGQERSDVIVNMLEVIKPGMNSAVFSGLLLNEGIPRYNELGFLYAEESGVTLEKATDVVTVGTTYNAGNNFDKKVNTLSSGNTYYVRAYAKNVNGVYYSSNEISFQTIQDYSEIKTDEVSDVDVLSGQATFNAVVSKVGVPIYSEKGFCYRKGTEVPSLDDEVIKVPGTSDGSFSAKVSGLELQATYSVCSYIIQNGNVFYGEARIFNTVSGAPLLTTSAVTDIGASSATFNAFVTEAGVPEYTERGFCYSDSGQPTITDNRKTVAGTGEGNYSLVVSGLKFDTYYYVRSYVIQNGKPYYGNTVTFRTVFVPTVVTTSAVTDIGASTATFNGSIENVGDPKCSQYGFCYSSASSNPTINDMTETRYGGYRGRISMDIEGLAEGKTYHVRAFAIQNGKPVYGETVSFKTLELPIVETLDATDVQPTEIWEGMAYGYSAKLNGNVIFPGTPAYISRGFAYGTTMNPVVGVDSSVTVGGQGTAGYFSATVSGLTGYKYYYVRAWVRTESGYIYGQSVKFSTF